MFTDFKLGTREDLGEQAFGKWKSFFNELLSTCCEINKTCAALLSNNRLTEEGEELVDCRGHPIAQMQDGLNQGSEQQFEDYENLILVGVWLAVQASGETLQRMLSWTDLPEDDND